MAFPTTLLAEFYLVLSPSGTYGKANVKTVTKQPNLQAGEISVKIKLKVPSKLFTTPTFTAEVEIPDVPAQDVSISVQENIARVVQENLGITLHLTTPEQGE